LVFDVTAIGIGGIVATMLRVLGGTHSRSAKGGNMKLKTLRVAGALLASAFFSAAGAQAPADKFPTRPVRMIVPGSPATGMDNMGRVVARGLTELFKQQVIIDNRAGAGSLIGSGIVAGATPDGYTIGVASTSTIVAPLLQTKPPFHPVKDFVNIALLSSITSVLVVAPELPAKNLKEFIEYAKARPGKLNFASVGAGSAAHLTPGDLQPRCGHPGGARAVQERCRRGVRDAFEPRALPHIHLARVVADAAGWQAAGVSGHQSQALCSAA
jgi:hypothetical protein